MPWLACTMDAADSCWRHAGYAHPSFTKTTIWPQGSSLSLPSAVRRKLPGSTFGACFCHSSSVSSICNLGTWLDVHSMLAKQLEGTGLVHVWMLGITSKLRDGPNVAAVLLQ